MSHPELISIVIAGVCCAVFLILWEAKKERKRAEQAEFDKYFKRLDDADKPNQKGL
jgi:hypothetical protein